MAKNKLFISTVVATVAASSVIPVGADMKAEAATPKFTDVPVGNSHYEAIINLAGRGIIKGYLDGTYAPGKQVTRGQAAKMIAGILGLDTGKGASTGFSDVSPQNEYAGAIAALKLAGIIDGYADGTFRPNDYIKRNHMVKIITRALRLQGTGATEMPFTDVQSEYKESISTLFEYGITTGTTATTFGGNAFMTRGQMASFIVRAEKAVQGVQTEQDKPSVKIVEATITIESIEKNKVIAEDQEWTIDENVQAMLNEGNAAALAGAQIEVILVDDKIADLLFIELNTSGQQGANSILDGGNTTFAGNITINADFVELKNMTVTENIVLTDRAKTNVAITQVNVKGDVIIQERAPIVTASLTNVATNFLVMPNPVTGQLTLVVQSGIVGGIVANGSATINSNTQLPYVEGHGGNLGINAPGVGGVYLYPTQQITLLQGSGEIDNLFLAGSELMAEILSNRLAIQQENDSLIQKMKEQLDESKPGVLLPSTLTEEELLKLQGNMQQMAQALEELQKKQQQMQQEAQKKQQELQREQQEKLQQLLQQMQQEQDNKGNLPRPNVNIGGTLQVNNLNLASPAVAIGLQPGVRVGTVRASGNLDQVRGRITAQAGQIANFISGNNPPVAFAAPPSNDQTDSGSSGGSSSGGSDIVNPNAEFVRLQQAIVEAKAGIVDVSVDGSTIVFNRQWTTQEVKDTFSKAIEEAERTAMKVNVTSTEALVAYQKLQEAKRFYDAAKKYGTMELSVDGLENYLSMAKGKLTEIEESIQGGNIAVSENGHDIPQANHWIPRSVKTAFATTITDAEKMLADAKKGNASIQKRSMALSQENINNMAERLEKLLNVHPLNGLQEVTAVQGALAGKQITLANDVVTDPAKILEEINKLIIAQNYTLTERQLEINGNQVTVNLQDAITYLNPTTFEFSELIPPITAHVKIITSFDTTQLETYLEKAREKAEEIKNMKVSVDGAEIPSTEQWLPKKVKDAFLARIAEAEAMLTKAQQGDATLTQEAIGQMAEKLEKSINIRLVNGLKEATDAKQLLNDQKIKTAAGALNKAEILIEIKKLAPTNEIVQGLTEDSLGISGNVVTVTLNGAIEDVDLETSQPIEIVPAITAQVTIIPQINLNAATLNNADIVLTTSENVPLELGARLTFTVGTNSIEGTVAENLQSNQIRITFAVGGIQLGNVITPISSENYQFILQNGQLTVS